MQGQLKEKLGTFSAVMVVISAMIGSGVFKKVSVMSADLQHSGWVLAAWAVAGLVTMMGSLSNAEVAGLIAKPGGQYVYFREMYGRLFAFLYGWSSFSVIQTATAASVAFVFSESVNALYPLPVLPEQISSLSFFSIGDFHFTPFSNFGVKMLACMLILVLSMINYRGIDHGERISNVFGVTVVAGILFVIGVAFFMGEREAVLSDHSEEFVAPGAAAFFSAMMAAFWAYEGWNNVGFLGGEIKDPKRNIPLALGLGTLIVMSLYILVHGAYFNLAGVDFFTDSTQNENSIAAVDAIRMVWPAGGVIISLLILVSTLNSTNNSLMTAPRIYYSMAHDGLFPKSAGRIHLKFMTPHRSIIYQLIWCLVLIISGSFDMLTEMLVFVAFIFYGCGAFGVIVLRYKMKDVPRPFKVPLYPVIPLFFTLFSAFLVYYSIQESPGNAVIGLFLVGLGLPVYYRLARNGMNSK